MPPFRRDRAEPMTANAIVGAARRVNLGRREEIEQLREATSSEWQRVAWRHYDEIGEIKYAYNYFAAIASRVRLYVGYQDEASDAPSPIGDQPGLSRSFTTAARYELSKLWQGRGGQPNFIRSAVLNTLVAGEGYLVGVHDSWNVRSTSELVFENDNRVRVTSSRANRKHGLALPEQAFVARFWRTHPEFSDEADSALKGVHSDCSELLLLSRIIRASAQSRLNAGLLYVADELRFQRSQDISVGDAPMRPDVDPFEEELTLALTEPIGITDSPSEIVPMIIRGPAEFAEKGIVRVDLSRGFDETLIKRHEQTLQRVLNGLDIPRDLVTGLANVRYSNAKSISEDMLKAHVEPIIVMLCEALTTVYLRTRMKARGYGDAYVKRLHVWYDPSEVVVRPDRSEDADKGYSRMLISAATWRRSHGFSETDKPKDDELALRIALSGSVAPSTTLDFLRKIAPEIVKEAERLAQESFGDPTLATNGVPVEAVPADPGAQPAETEPAIGEQAPPPAIAPAPVAVTPPVSDPPEGTLPPQDQFRAAQVIDIMHALTAATSLQTKTVRERTRRLERSLEVERRLRESLFVHLNDIVRRALERAGARTVSKIRNSDLKSLVTDVPIESVFSAIPEARRQEFALDAERLVSDTIERARGTYAGIVAEAQDQGWRALGNDVFVEMKKQQSNLIARSWRWLVKQLTTLTTNWLSKPKTSGNYVPMSVVRGAQALAGGADDDRPTSSGKAILSPVALNATGWEFSTRYRWVYGVSENSYEPHVKLDDTVFGSWTADELSGPGEKEWPFVAHHFPGDHNGCRCDWLPEVLDPKQVNAPVRGQTWDDVPIAASANVILSTTNGRNGSVQTIGDQK